MTDVAGYELMVELKTNRRQAPNFPGAAFHNIVSIITTGYKRVC